MGLCAAAEPNAVRRVANSRRDDRQQPQRLVIFIDYVGQDWSTVNHLIPEFDSVCPQCSPLPRLVDTPVAARYGRRHMTRRTRASHARLTGSAGHSPRQTRCTSPTTTGTSVQAASLSLTRSTRRLPIASHRASILSLYSARSCNSDICCLSVRQDYREC